MEKRIIDLYCSYLAVSIFLRLPIAIKSLLLGAMGIVYILLIELSHAPVFECYDRRSVSMVPLHIISVIVAVVFVLAVALHGRQVTTKIFRLTLTGAGIDLT